MLLRKCRPEHVIEGNMEGGEDYEEYLTSCWMTLRKGKIMEFNKKRRYLEFERRSTRSGEHVLEETIYL
jgi:hypothetical protein